MSNEQQDPRPEQQPETLDARGRTRRRLGKAALGTAPVLMTLHSAPLKAAGANCTPSGWVSGNTSKHPDLEDCGGRTPGYWAGGNPNQPDGWKNNKDSPLNSSYGFPGLGTYPGSGDDGNATMLDAVSGPGQQSLGISSSDHNDKRQVIRFGTAALLNAKYTVGYPLSEALIREMVTEVIDTGEYQTSTGETLNMEQMHAFLKNTMDIPSWGP